LIAGISADEVAQGTRPFGFSLSVWFCVFGLSCTMKVLTLPLSVPLSLPGVLNLLLLKFTGLENNIYAQVAMVML
jgi:HAE1 family hydrophobic/amphiphilic exporter-1